MKDTQSQVFSITRPAPALLTYYALSSLVLGPLFFVILIPLYFRYHTLRYEFDEEGISMRWGIIFRREITLTYGRIQDIHLVSNIVERWLGLARIQVQTASASAEAEMTLEGLHEFAVVRDYLYSRMRGVQRSAAPRTAATADGSLAAVLREIAHELRALRSEVENRRGQS